jgi:hypothetical protein
MQQAKGLDFGGVDGAGVAVIPTRVGIHSRDQHRSGWEGNRLLAQARPQAGL